MNTQPTGWKKRMLEVLDARWAVGEAARTNTTMKMRAMALVTAGLLALSVAPVWGALADNDGEAEEGVVTTTEQTEKADDTGDKGSSSESSSEKASEPKSTNVTIAQGSVTKENTESGTDDATGTDADNTGDTGDNAGDAGDNTGDTGEATGGTEGTTEEANDNPYAGIERPEQSDTVDTKAGSFTKTVNDDGSVTVKTDTIELTAKHNPDDLENTPWRVSYNKETGKFQVFYAIASNAEGDQTIDLTNVLTVLNALAQADFESWGWTKEEVQSWYDYHGACSGATDVGRVDFSVNPETLEAIVTMQPGDRLEWEVYISSDSSHTYKYKDGSFTLATSDTGDEVTGVVGFDGQFLKADQVSAGSVTLGKGVQGVRDLLYNAGVVSSTTDSFFYSGSSLTPDQWTAVANYLKEQGYTGTASEMLESYLVDYYTAKYVTDGSTYTSLKDLANANASVAMEVYGTQNNWMFGVDLNNSATATFVAGEMGYTDTATLVNEKNTKNYSMTARVQTEIELIKQYCEANNLDAFDYTGCITSSTTSITASTLRTYVGNKYGTSSNLYKLLTTYDHTSVDKLYDALNGTGAAKALANSTNTATQADAIATSMGFTATKTLKNEKYVKNYIMSDQVQAEAELIKQYCEANNLDAFDYTGCITSSTTQITATTLRTYVGNTYGTTSDLYKLLSKYSYDSVVNLYDALNETGSAKAKFAQSLGFGGAAITGNGNVNVTIEADPALHYNNYYQHLYSFVIGNEDQVKAYIEANGDSWGTNDGSTTVGQYMAGKINAGSQTLGLDLLDAILENTSSDAWANANEMFNTLTAGGMTSDEASWIAFTMALNIDGEGTGNEYQVYSFSAYSSIILHQTDGTLNLTKVDDKGNVIGDDEGEDQTSFYLWNWTDKNGDGIQDADDTYNYLVYVPADEETGTAAHYAFVEYNEETKTLDLTVKTTGGSLKVDYALLEDVIYYIQEAVAPKGYQLDTNIYVLCNNEPEAEFLNNVYNALTGETKNAIWAQAGIKGGETLNITFVNAPDPSNEEMGGPDKDPKDDPSNDPKGDTKTDTKGDADDEATENIDDAMSALAKTFDENPGFVLAGGAAGAAALLFGATLYRRYRKNYAKLVEETQD